MWDGHFCCCFCISQPEIFLLVCLARSWFMWQLSKYYWGYCPGYYRYTCSLRVPSAHNRVGTFCTSDGPMHE